MYFTINGTDAQDEYSIQYLPRNQDIFLAFPLMSVSFTAHYNVLRIYFELETRTPEKMSKVISVSVIGTLIAYTVMGVVGYIGFLETVEDDILTNLDETLWYASLARFAICLTIIFSYPLVHFANRASIANVLWPNDRVVSRKKLAMITFVIVPVTLAVGYSWENVSDVFFLSGSTAGVAIVYVIPALVYIKGNIGINFFSKPNTKALCVLFFGITFGAIGFVIACIDIA